MNNTEQNPSKQTEENLNPTYSEQSVPDIRNMIYTLRNQQVMLDNDLAKLYQVETKRLNEAVKRNIARFP